jgi:hypothetical protein
MAFIRDALSSLPAKPALIVAPLLVVLVLSLYYRDQYNRCAEVRQARDQLNTRLRAIDSPGRFRLADFTDFAWNKVRIVASVQPGTMRNECPFDWNWDDGEREALIDAGLLTAIIFGHGGKVVRYLELRGDEVSFRGAEGNLTPETAVFDLSRKSGRDDGVTLTLKN